MQVWPLDKRVVSTIISEKSCTTSPWQKALLFVTFLAALGIADTRASRSIGQFGLFFLFRYMTR